MDTNDFIVIDDDDSGSGDEFDSDSDGSTAPVITHSKVAAAKAPAATAPPQIPLPQTAKQPTQQDMKQEPMETAETLPDIISNEAVAEDKKNQGNNEYKAQNYNAALRLYSDAISLCPESPAYYGNRAACQMMLGNFRAALQDAKTAVRLDDKFEKGYVRIVKCNIALGDLMGCEQAVKRLRELDPRTDTHLKPELHQLAQLRDLEQKAMACYEKDDFRTVVFHMDSASKIATGCHRYKLLKAECLAQLGRVDDACDLAVMVMKVDSNSADAIYVRGLCLYYGDNLDKAVQHFERALQLDPDHAKAKSARQMARKWKDLKERGNQLFNTGKYRDAIECYSEALKVDSRALNLNSKIYYNRALVNSKLGNLMDAISDCSAALAANQSYLKALLLRARCHNDLEMYEECVRDYEQAQTQQKTAEIRQLLNEAKVNLKRSKRKDYYKILGVLKTANTEEIKKAYRKRAMVHHPDRHSHSSDAEKKEQEKKFKEVGEAYAVLSDAQKRNRYDQGKDLDDQFGGGGHDMFDASQLFRHFNMEFGGAGGRGGPSFHFG